MADLLMLEEMSQADVKLVGGKGYCLSLMVSAGLPVPPGFCLTTEVFRQHGGKPFLGDQGVCERIGAAYQQLGGSQVAVRSSGVVEDSAMASYAGQQTTLLAVNGKRAVLDAIARCWASLNSERALVYRQYQPGHHKNSAMAVIVQRMIFADVAGVLFTRDPTDPLGTNMLVEASWGLGESVVSGRVTPDSYCIDRETGAVVKRQIHAKTTMVTATGCQTVPSEKQGIACLDEPRLRELAEIGRKIETVFGDARDVEWAWAEGRFWLLQARPITARNVLELEQVRLEEIANLTNRIKDSGTVWSRYNLSEILPAPTPMTWSIVQRFVAGRGGYGLMYRDLGFSPEATLDEEGIFDLVCGRPYCNLSREPKLYFPQLPFKHSFTLLKKSPEKAFYPKPILDASEFGLLSWTKLLVYLPLGFFRLMRHQSILKKTTAMFATRFREELAPSFEADVASQAASDLSQLDDAALLLCLEKWLERTLVAFARDSLKPSALAGILQASLEQKLALHLGEERANVVSRELIVGVRPDPEADLAQAMSDLRNGRISKHEFLSGFGHRGRNEMELSEPRWAESADELDACLTPEPHLPQRLEPAEIWKTHAAEANLKPAREAELFREVEALREYVGLRETAKHYLMMGYALIRQILVEIDRRHQLNGGVFYLTLADLPKLSRGIDVFPEIARARRRRALCLSIEVPPVLFSDDLEAIGRPLPVTEAACLQGVPLSPGVAEGPALVLQEPTIPVGLNGSFVLVCPSTDPGWVPLFARACGLVMETGGVLSHGAILAREFGLPAVAGLPGILNQIRTGQRLKVNGNRGTVTILDSSSTVC